MGIPVIITSFNQLTWLRAMVDDLLVSDVAYPVIVDNASDYPPLVEYLGSNPCRVVLRSDNDGPGAAWNTPELTELMGNGPYVVTDSDLGLSGVDLRAAIADMLAALDKWPELTKAGLSLRLDDLPNTPIAHEARGWEKQFWERPTKCPDGYCAPIDTTFAAYRAGADRGGCDPAWRSVHSARHMPWYRTEADDELRQMLATSRRDLTMWTARMADKWEIQ